MSLLLLKLYECKVYLSSMKEPQVPHIKTRYGVVYNKFIIERYISIPVRMSVYFLSRHIAGQVVYHSGCPKVKYFQRMLKVRIRAAAPNDQFI